MVKHKLNGSEDAPLAKRPKHSPEVLKDLKKVQNELAKIDDECAKEQIQIQRKYTAMMQPLFKERQEVCAKLPYFWPTVIAKHMEMESYGCFEDNEILQHLSEVNLEDNIDNNGSYQLTMIFTDAVKEFFEPTVLKKRVKYEGLNEGETIEECTEIQWKQGKSPIEVAKARREKRLAKLAEKAEGDHSEEDDDDEDDVDVLDGDVSIFEWFTNQHTDIDFGEGIRREVWHNALDIYFAAEEEMDEDDDDGGEKAEEEVAVNENEEGGQKS